MRDGLAAAKITRTTYHRWRQANPEFAARADEAISVGFGALEAAAMKRAFEGWERPIYHQGEQVGSETLYSDRLAEFMLKVNGPDKYRITNKNEVSGPNGGPVQTTIRVIWADGSEDGTDGETPEGL